MLTALFLTCLAASLSYLVAKRATTIQSLSLIWSSLIGILSLASAYPALTGAVTEPTRLWHVQPFGALLLVLIGFVQWTATLASGPYLKQELEENIITLNQLRVYAALLPLFVLSMILTVTANTIGLLWVTLESTTLATALLVAFYTKDGSLEAAWKYLVLCSVGISLGLIGTLLLAYAAVGSHLDANFVAGASWNQLHAIATQLSPSLVRIAFIFLFIGFGTKIGLVPLHTWLPDAHGRTPSPISGMLSGLLLNVALFALLRYKGIVDTALSSDAWSNGLFLAFGALSFIVPAAFILIQRNYKRLFAYSSIEHMGFIVFCISLGKSGLAAMTIHLIGHALTKSMLFFGAGNLVLRWKSTKVDKIGSIMRSLPYTGTLMILGLLFLLATPPSPLFVSEYLAFSQSILGHPILTLSMLLAASIIVAGSFRNLGPALFGVKADNQDKSTEQWNVSHTAMTLHLIGLIVIGILVLAPTTRTYLEQLAGSIY